MLKFLRYHHAIKSKYVLQLLETYIHEAVMLSYNDFHVYMLVVLKKLEMHLPNLQVNLRFFDQS